MQPEQSTVAEQMTVEELDVLVKKGFCPKPLKESLMNRLRDLRQGKGAVENEQSTVAG